MTIAKKHAQSYMPNGELSLEQVIQAAIDEAAASEKEAHQGVLKAWLHRMDQWQDTANGMVNELQERIRQLEAERVPDGWQFTRSATWTHIDAPDGAHIAIRLPFAGKPQPVNDAATMLYKLVDAMLAAATAQEKV